MRLNLVVVTNAKIPVSIEIIRGNKTFFNEICLKACLEKSRKKLVGILQFYCNGRALGYNSHLLRLLVLKGGSPLRAGK